MVIYYYQKKFTKKRFCKFTTLNAIMNLIVDVGNTRTKVAVFKQNQIVFENSFELKAVHSHLNQILKSYSCTHAIISSVANEKLAPQLASKYPDLKLIELNSETPVPFKNDYASPQTLGVDRIALAAAAFTEFPHKNVLIIDAGTCITYDFLSAKGSYKGGAIAPGLQMRYAALNHFTARLPLIDKTKKPDNFIGDTTENSILAGVFYGMVYEIQGVITKYESQFEHLTVILTGGDMQILSKTLKNTIFANPKFLIQGLNHILEYNKH
jgi:type III pantothenate kinase